MEDVEDFKYEFDLSMYFDYCTHNEHISSDLFNGYVCLHQFVKNNIDYAMGECNIFNIINPLLEKGETFEYNDNIFELKLNTVNDDIVNYVKFLIKCSLTLIKNFRIENNVIKWEIDYDTH